MSVKTKIKLRVLFSERIVPSAKDFGLVIGFLILFSIFLYFYPISDLHQLVLAMMAVFAAVYTLVVVAWYFIEISPLVEELYEEQALRAKYSFIAKRFEEEK